MLLVSAAIRQDGDRNRRALLQLLPSFSKQEAARVREEEPPSASPSARLLLLCQLQHAAEPDLKMLLPLIYGIIIVSNCIALQKKAT